MIPIMKHKVVTKSPRISCQQAVKSLRTTLIHTSNSQLIDYLPTTCSQRVDTAIYDVCCDFFRLGFARGTAVNGEALWPFAAVESQLNLDGLACRDAYAAGFHLARQELQTSTTTKRK